jgi:hypothetical protein
MITITQSDVAASGGVLAALADKSCECIRRVLKSGWKEPPQDVLGSLERIIVHTEPHLDEYFAELLFRSCLPREKQKCEFIEQSVFSATNDLGCQHLWPSAAVLGIGSTAAAGVMPLFLFDEHVSGQSKIAASCSQVVAEKMFNSIPAAVATVLTEVNAIDEFGGGHPQNLNNLIKTLHEARFWFGKDTADDTEMRDNLTPEWKRAIVDACLAAVITCVEDGIDLKSEPAAKRASLTSSLDNYIQCSVHAGHPRFQDTANRIRSVFGDQVNVFRDAFLRNRRGPINDAAGQPIPQLLILSRVCFACEHCWGTKLRDVITTHFWEQEFQKQLNFYAVEDTIKSLFATGKGRAVTPIGAFTRTGLPEIMADVRTAGAQQQIQKKKRPVWVVSVTPAAGIFKPNQAISSFINKNNGGCGLILVRDTMVGTSALFKCSAIPQTQWQRLVSEIINKEGESNPSLAGNESESSGCWYVPRDSGGGIAPFILNGNKSHQYVPRSGLDATALCELVKRTFY